MKNEIQAFNGLQLTQRILTFQKVKIAPIAKPQRARISFVNQYPDPVRIDHDFYFKAKMKPSFSP